MVQELPLVSAFDEFIKDTIKGKRLKPNGDRIKPQSIENYRCVLKHLKQFEIEKKGILRIRPLRKLNMRQLSIEKKYWTKFYRRFSEYLFQHDCFDNYVGNIFKILRVFFHYLNTEKLLLTGEFYKSFYIRREAIPILTLDPSQLQFLISNKDFEDSLPSHLRRIKDIFVLGCTVALRYSDIFNISVRDVECVNQNHYLSVRTIKTSTDVKVKLPHYAVEIVKKYSKRKTPASKVFNPISLNQFNSNVKKLLELAGWTSVIGKTRCKNGKRNEIVKLGTIDYRFCDLASSHLMRRTAVTTMLLLGMPETAVKKVSGHALNSSAFYRYVNYVQAYLDLEIEKVHAKLINGVNQNSAA